MEIRAYPVDYLDNAMVTMATMLDYAVNVRFEHIDYFFHSFLLSPYAQQFERGNPTFITGKTGVELYRLVRMDFSYPPPELLSLSTARNLSCTASIFSPKRKFIKVAGYPTACEPKVYVT